MRIYTASHHTTALRCAAPRSAMQRNDFVCLLPPLRSATQHFAAQRSAARRVAAQCNTTQRSLKGEFK